MKSLFVIIIQVTKRYIMKSRINRQFTQEFKLEAVKLVTEQAYKVAAAAEAVGINPSLMAKWVKAFKDSSDIANAFPGKGFIKPQDAEVYELRKQLKKVSTERDILKKAMAYFANPPE